jgi:hypothetical protein
MNIIEEAIDLYVDLRVLFMERSAQRALEKAPERAIRANSDFRAAAGLGVLTVGITHGSVTTGKTDEICNVRDLPADAVFIAGERFRNGALTIRQIREGQHSPEYRLG